MRVAMAIEPASALSSLAALGALALLALPSIAAAKDRNHDKIPDRWEKRHHLSLDVNQAGRDQDRDHLDNRGEFRAGDNPRDRDTDNDGVMDGDENAGTIASYDTETGKLMITLFGGDTVSGLVTDDTRIRCGHGVPQHGRRRRPAASASRHGEDELRPRHSGDDNSGPGNGDDDSDDPPSTTKATTTAKTSGDDAGDDHGDDPAGQRRRRRPRSRATSRRRPRPTTTDARRQRVQLHARRPGRRRHRRRGGARAPQRQSDVRGDRAERSSPSTE